MATRSAPPTDPPEAPLSDAAVQARRWTGDYPDAGHDLLHAGTRAAWTAMFEELAAGSGNDLVQARARVARHVADLGIGFRVAGDAAARPWPAAPVPLLIAAEEWAGVAAGVAQRADLLERVLADLYGPQRLVTEGALPAALVAGNPLFLRPLAGLSPPGGHHLRLIAIDLARGPSGEWRVLADHLRAPVGAGYALENRLALARTLGGLQARLGIQRHAPFFAAFRAGIAAACRRTDPRIGLLTPGRYNPSFAEQAHLARYLGLLLVEGDDLAALDDKLYVRTVAGLKRIDALWSRLDPRLLDPLAFDTHSRLGVAGLVDAYGAGNLVLANAPGAGVLEAPAFAAFLPALAGRLLGAPLALPNIATWWCGGAAECAHVAAHLDGLAIGPAFGHLPLGLADDASRADLLADLARRPQDYVAQEEVRLSTTPVAIGDRLEPRPFTLRAFAARGADGGWVVMPGGLARIGEHPHATWSAAGEGQWSADVCVHGAAPVARVSLLAPADSLHVRRSSGTLPSRVADDLYWLGRYLERGEALLGAVRVLLGRSTNAEGGLPSATLARLVGLVAGTGAAPAPADLSPAALAAFARTALDDGRGQGIAAIDAQACRIGESVRDRLSGDMLRLLEVPARDDGTGLTERAATLQRRYAALAGLSAEHMVRTEQWRFLDLGRRIERAAAIARAVRLFGMAGAGDDDLQALLDLADGQIGYRQRYPTGVARVAVVDLVALDPGNPRGLAFQADRIVRHLSALPVLAGDGMAEPQQAHATALAAAVATANAATLDADAFGDIERRVATLSDAVAYRYFLQGADPLRAAELTLG